MCSKFCYKDYFSRISLNELYDCIAETIRNFSDDSMENNYVKFVIKYCRFHKQGNKNIVFLFLTGLNPINFKDAFNKIIFDDKEYNNDYYNNMPSLIDKITPKKKVIKNIDKHHSEENKINCVEESGIGVFEKNKINVIENKKANEENNKENKHNGIDEIINSKIDNNNKIINNIETKNLNININDKTKKIDINKNDGNNDLKRKTEGLDNKENHNDKNAQIPMNFMKN